MLVYRRISRGCIVSGGKFGPFQVNRRCERLLISNDSSDCRI